LNRYAVHCREYVSETLYIEAGDTDEAREKAAEPRRKGSYDVPGIMRHEHVFHPLTPRLSVEEYVGTEWPPPDPLASTQVPPEDHDDDIPF
jgi:hypothetical protein